MTNEAPQGLIDTITGWFRSQAPAPSAEPVTAPAPEPEPEPAERPRNPDGTFAAAAPPASPPPPAPPEPPDIQAMVDRAVAAALANQAPPAAPQPPVAAAAVTPAGSGGGYDASNIHLAPEKIQREWKESGGLARAIASGDMPWFDQK